MVDSQKVLEDIAMQLMTFLKASLTKKQVSVGDWLSEWYETYKKPNIISHRKIEIAIRLHIPKSIKNNTLDDLTAPMIQRALNAVNTSRNRETVYNVYSEALRTARTVGYIQIDPMLGVLRPKHRRQRGRALTENQQAEFLASIEDASEFAVYCTHIILTGSRPGEPLRLNWSDIDERAGRLHIRGTKTAGADRYIPLFPGILNNLNRLPRTDDRVFRYGYDYYESRFTALDFYDYTLKDLRHTFATRGLEAGVSMKTMQLWLGHSTYEQTANTYSHVLPKFEAAEAAKLRIVI